MQQKQFETGRGTKGLIGMLVLSASILSSTFIMGMKIQRLIDALEGVRTDHQRIQAEIKQLEDKIK